MKNILGRKQGMTRIFSDEGKVEAVTVISAGPCAVTQVKTNQRDGYQAVQLGYEESKRLSKPRVGHLKRGAPFRHLKEFRLEDLGDAQVGQTVDVSAFSPGDFVNVTGFSKGRGFAGGIKRHNFRGGPKTHGQSDRWRAPGSIGAGTTPGRVFKGTPMAGHMGNRRVTVAKLEVLQVNIERNLLLVKGAVPGAKNGIVVVRESGKKA